MEGTMAGRGSEGSAAGNGGLRAWNERLRAENERLRDENGRLRARLREYEAIEQETFACKRWTDGDIRSCLEEMGFSGRRENIAAVRGSGWGFLLDCTDEEWDGIRRCIADAAREGRLLPA